MSEPAHLADRTEIADLLSRLNHWLDDHRLSWQDDRRYADLDRLYTTDTVARSPRGTVHGLDELIAHVRSHSTDAQRTQHVTSDVLIDVDGDQANVTANTVVYFYRPDEGPFLATGLRASFTAVRTPLGWRLASTEMTPLWRTPLTA
ncbi:nuclear transport factor 2 family protein [Spirillospora sp. NPDC048911]|uniref:nuclear transport factor 2 family protein n=1 Tax=Spirillospora sp. NPDC048911 TaxID=3364527 RepID=UPI00371CAA9C